MLHHPASIVGKSRSVALRPSPAFRHVGDCPQETNIKMANLAKTVVATGVSSGLVSLLFTFCLASA